MGVYDTNHLGELPGTAGPTTGWGANFDAVFNSASQVDSMLGVETESLKRWEASVLAYQKATGEVFSMEGDGGPYRSQAIEINQFIQPILDPNNERIGANAWLSGSEKPEQTRINAAKNVEKMKEINEKITALNNPDIPNIQTILKQLGEEYSVIETRAAEVGENASWLGTIGGFVGGVAGSFTYRDPQNYLTLGFGGGGKNVAARLLTEMAAAGATEYAVQETSIQPTREALGLPEGDVWKSVLYSAVGAGAIRGGLEGLGYAGRRLNNSILDENFRFDFDDPQLRQVFESMPATPRTKAAVSLLEDNARFVRYNPYGDTEVGSQRFDAELSNIHDVISGRSETAVVRFMPEVAYDLENLTFETLAVKEQVPGVYERWEVAHQRLVEIDQRIADVEQGITNLTIADAVGKIDEPSGQLIRSFEEELQQPNLTSREKQTIVERMNTVVQSIGETNVARAMRDVEISPRQELKTLRNSRRLANKEYRAARNELDRQIGRVKAAEAAKAIAPTPDDVRVPLARKPGDFNPDGLRRDVVAQSVVDAKQVNDAIPDISNRVLVENRPVEVEGENVPPPAPKTSYDLGNGQSVDADFTIDLGDGQVLSARAIFDDLESDEALLEAMKVCMV